ncbi:hypothetical protein BKA61DRAFT_575977 [Leptodontidium sp. MPI-SDFR-AT-0119]|nr:hypothetical protein BKA61DRAFT_575977 [Leptodontidium sp. MPI-SDFR-AT-0119]
MSRSRGVESEAYDARGTSHFLREEKSVEDEEEDEDMGFGLFDDGTPAPKSLTFEEGAWEETGMTTTYDVPSTKTLSPNNSTIKHKIAKIDFKNVIFSHIVVVPVSEDERLKIEISNPRGLKVGGDPVRAGQSAFTAPAVASSSGSVRGSAKDVRASVYSADGKEVAAQNGKWGSAVATTKKSGEVV